MRELFKVNLLMVIVVFGFFAAQASAGDATVLKTDKDKVNYAVGVNFIGTIKQQGVGIDLDLVMKGMKDAYSGGKLLLSNEEMGKAMDKYRIAVMQKRSKVISKSTGTSRNQGKTNK